MDTLAPGLTGHASRTVAPTHTAAALGSGTLDVFGTPALLALMEAAAVAAVTPALAPDTTTVGVYVELHHLAATPLGLAVRAEATLTAVEGRTLTFMVEAFDTLEPIGRALHRRMLVHTDRFMQRVQAKQGR
jgi:predicted thioesterase